MPIIILAHIFILLYTLSNISFPFILSASILDKIKFYLTFTDVETETWRGCVLAKDKQVMNAGVEKKI